MQIFYKNFQKLFILLEYLARKNNFMNYFYLFGNQKYYEIYGTMENIELEN